MASVLETLLERQGIFWDSKANHIHYLTHVINLVVTSYLDNLKIDGLYFTTTLDKLVPLLKQFAPAPQGGKNSKAAASPTRSNQSLFLLISPLVGTQHIEC